MFTLIALGIVIICLLSIDHHIWHVVKMLKKILAEIKEENEAKR